MQKISPEIEEYLETIYRLKEKGKTAKTGEVAKELGISAPSVSEMFDKLAKAGLITYDHYKGASITKKGEEIGKSVLRKHRLIEKLLMFLGVNGSRVHREACELEHVVSNDVENAIRRKLSSDTHWIGRRNTVRLTEMRDEEKGRIAFIMAGVGATQRLADMGLTPGSDVKILRVSNYGGPINLSVRGSILALGQGVASKVFVEVRGHRKHHHRIV